MQQSGQDYWVPTNMELTGFRRATHRDTVTILDTETTSEAVDLRGYGLLGLILPDLTAGNLTFEASDIEAGPYVAVHDDLGAPVAIVAGAGDVAIDTEALAPLAGYRWVKIVSAAAQGADREIIWILKG